MTRDAGVVRSAASLDRPRRALATMEASDPEEPNLLTVSRALVHAASARRESRGTHTRSDYPEPSPEFLGRFVFAGDDDARLRAPARRARARAVSTFDAPVDVIAEVVARALAEDLGPLGDLTAALLPVDARATPTSSPVPTA